MNSGVNVCTHRYTVTWSTSMPAFGQQLFHIAIGQPVAHVPAHRNRGDLTREAIPRRSRRHERPRPSHPFSLRGDSTTNATGPRPATRRQPGTPASPGPNATAPMDEVAAAQHTDGDGPVAAMHDDRLAGSGTGPMGVVGAAVPGRELRIHLASDCYVHLLHPHRRGRQHGAWPTEVKHDSCRPSGSALTCCELKVKRC